MNSDSSDNFSNSLCERPLNYTRKNRKEIAKKEAYKNNKEEYENQEKEYEEEIKKERERREKPKSKSLNLYHQSNQRKRYKNAFMQMRASNGTC